MKRIFNYAIYLQLVFSGFMGFSVVSCSDEYNDIVPNDTENEFTTDDQPTVDEVKALFNGTVAIPQPINDDAMPYLTKRFINTTTEITENADVVVLGDNEAATFINNSDNFNDLRKLWTQNKIVTFINPSTNSILLIKKLQGVDKSEINQNDIAAEAKSLTDINVLAIRADGTSILLEHVGTINDSDSVITTISEDGSTEEDVDESEINSEYTPSDYEKGLIGENFAEWLNENALIGNQPDIAFSRSASNYSSAPVIKTYHHYVTISHSWIKQYDKKANVPNTKTIDVKSVITINGAYAPELGDIYDVVLSQEYPADQVYNQNTIVYKSAAYKYKYTGSCYSGPSVTLALKGLSLDSDVELSEVAPLPATNGSYRATHNPMTVSLGGSLQGNVSTSGIGMTGGFSFGITLPSTTIQFTHAEMPVSFSNIGDVANWKYSSSFKVYDHTWGSNGRFIGLPDICHSFCKTDQAVTFVVKDTQNYGDKPLTLDYDVAYNTYSEYCRVWNVKQNRQSFKFAEHGIALPQVSRFFGKYTPYHMPNYSGSADSDNWATLNNMLMDNVNYRALCDEVLQVGSTTEKGLDVNATKIWRDALTALVNQYQGTKTDRMYVVALAKSDGSHLPLGLVIKDGVWTITEDVNKVPHPAN